MNEITGKEPVQNIIINNSNENRDGDNKNIKYGFYCVILFLLIHYCISFCIIKKIIKLSFLCKQIPKKIYVLEAFILFPALLIAALIAGVFYFKKYIYHNLIEKIEKN